LPPDNEKKAGGGGGRQGEKEKRKRKEVTIAHILKRERFGRGAAGARFNDAAFLGVGSYLGLLMIAI